MNAENSALAASLVPATYISQGSTAVARREHALRSVLAQRRIPDEGWDELQLEWLLRELAAMDSNNFLGNVGAGEREARIACPMVARRHFFLGHGIGRSGDVSETQPKAAGSSLIMKTTNVLLLDYVRMCGLRRMQSAVVMPVATGMSLTMCLLTLKASKPEATHVVWPRIDQKSCFKSMLTAGLVPLVVENELQGDELRTDVAAVRAAIERVGAGRVLCVMSTTSCFAPRARDRVEQLAQLCEELGVAHVINNAYGLQSSQICHEINEACRARVDCVVQSLDKNLLVPVGGAIVCSPAAERVRAVSQMYPGRASMAPTLDAFITLLSLGRAGLTELLQRRKRLFPVLQAALARAVAPMGGRVLHTPHNPISIAVALPTGLARVPPTPPAAASADAGEALATAEADAVAATEPASMSSTLADVGGVPREHTGRSEDGRADSAHVAEAAAVPPVAAAAAAAESAGRESSVEAWAAVDKAARKRVTLLGAKLFANNVSGARVVSGVDDKDVGGVMFMGWGANGTGYPVPYITAACAVGMREEEIGVLCSKVAKAMAAMLKGSGR